MLQSLVKGAEQIPISIKQGSKMTSAAVMLYSKVHQLKAIPQKGLIILFDVGHDNIGHFCCVWSDSSRKRFYWFDSTGHPFGQFMHATHNSMQNLQVLFRGGQLISNKTRFQRNDKHFNTCFRHCVVRTRFHMLDHKKYTKFFGKFEPDMAVTMLTLIK